MGRRLAPWILLLPVPALAASAAPLSPGRYRAVGRIEFPCKASPEAPAGWCLVLKPGEKAEQRLPALPSAWDGPIRSMPGHLLKCVGKWDGHGFTPTEAPHLMMTQGKSLLERLGDIPSASAAAAPLTSPLQTRNSDSL